MTDRRSLPAETRVDSVTLRVRSARPLVGFYEDVVGLVAEENSDRVELSAGEGPPLLVLCEDRDAPERERDAAGLYHVAYRVPARAALGDALRRIRRSDHPLAGAADHVASEALYLSDPEGNGVEIYCDRPRDEWEHTDSGEVRLPGDPLDLDDLAAAANGDSRDMLPDGSDVGHVHLEATDLDESTYFYRDLLGFRLRRRKPRATFLAGGDYHHHLAVNTRAGRTTPYRPGALGLDSVTFAVPREAYDALRERVRERGVDADELGDGIRVADPDGIPIVVTPDDAD